MKSLPATVVALIAVVVLIGSGWLVLQGKVPDEFRVPVIAVFSIAAMFALIAFLAAIYQSVALSSTTQALGLPEGSVRALIALGLIVVFTVITLFMLARLTSVEDLCNRLTSTLAAVKDANAGVAAKDAIAVVNARQQAAQDLAKQLLTMLGTLLAAVSSFYFGSSATSAATTAGAAAAAAGAAGASGGGGGAGGGGAATPGGPGGGNAGGAGGGNPGGAGDANAVV
jgi:hypothetical protein